MKSWTQEEINYVVENYQRLSVNQIAKDLNKTVNAVRLKASRNGCKKSPYNCNYAFFKTIDNEEKAYWLGFIYADGYVTVNEKTNSGCVGIELQARDVEHLRKFNKSIEGNYKIDFRDRTCKVSGNGNMHTMCMVRVFSIDMVNDLIAIGAKQDKTYTMQLPSIPEELYPHFIRGFFDGDGCIYIKNNNGSNKTRCTIASVSDEFLNQIRTYLYENNINSYLYISKHENDDRKNLYVLELAGKEYTNKFLDFIYSDASIYLDRKYEKYLNIVKTT